MGGVGPGVVLGEWFVNYRRHRATQQQRRGDIYLYGFHGATNHEEGIQGILQGGICMWKSKQVPYLGRSLDFAPFVPAHTFCPAPSKNPITNLL